MTDSGHVRGKGGSIHGTALGPSAPLAKAYLFAERPIEDGGLVSNPVINIIYWAQDKGFVLLCSWRKNREDVPSSKLTCAL